MDRIRSFVVLAAHDLQPDRQSVSVESARHRDHRKAGQVQGPDVAGGCEPDVLDPAVHVDLDRPDSCGGNRYGRRHQRVDLTQRGVEFPAGRSAGPAGRRDSPLASTRPPWSSRARTSSPKCSLWPASRRRWTDDASASRIRRCRELAVRMSGTRTSRTSAPSSSNTRRAARVAASTSGCRFSK